MRPRRVITLKRLVNPRAGWKELDEKIWVEHRDALLPDHGGFDVRQVRVARWQFLLDHV